MPNILIYGGTFNPVHVGHLRLAIEARQSLGDRIQRVEFLPNLLQPLKAGNAILPFDLRVALLKKALEKQPGFYCNEVEGARNGPSYTYDTLANYPEARCRRQKYFLLGSEDFAQLFKWYRGLELPDVTNFVVAPRSESFEPDSFYALCKNFWGDACGELVKAELAGGDGFCLTLHNGGQIYYIKIPYIDVSATQIRRDWLAGKNIDYLVPEEAAAIMDRNRERIKRVWEGNKQVC